MKSDRKATLKEKLVWYKFSPKVIIWCTKGKEKKLLYYKNVQESWYGGYFFIAGVFVLVPLHYINLHIRFNWWRMDFTQRGWTTKLRNRYINYS